MKKYLVATLLALALIPHSLATAAEEHHHGHGDAPAVNLSLNDGQKWIADKHTSDAVANMASMVGKTGADASAEFLRALGAQLQEQLDGLIRGCKMTGPAHDQLHTWIVALAPAIQALGKSADAETGRDALAKLSELFAAYDKHFQAASK